MFKNKPEPEEVKKVVFTIEWTQTNTNGVLDDRKYSIGFSDGLGRDSYSSQWIFNISPERMKELRDLLNKTCLE